MTSPRSQSPSQSPAPSPSSSAGGQETYPRQEAATRRFRLGVPRGFHISPDGSRVAFIRSASGRDPVGCLWVADADGHGGLAERLVVDAHDLARDDADLPAAERARRERMRETTSGITAFSADDAATLAAFSLDGDLYVVDLVNAGAAPRRLPTPGPAVDPRLSPDARHIAFVCDRSLYCVTSDGDAPSRALAVADAETVSWGLADFIAAEELDRVRGLWWLAGSRALLAERADDADVAVRWIADPAQPDREPTPHRYPAAGTTNPQARLFQIPLDGGDPQEVTWDHDAYPYLATVQPDDQGGAVISVLSRDQQHQLILSLDDGTATVLTKRTTEPWITLQPGVPRRGPGRSLLEIVADPECDTFRVVADGTPLTPPGLQACGVVSVVGDRIVVTGQADPRDQALLEVTMDGRVSPLVDDPGIHSAVAGEGGIVIASSTADAPGARFTARLTQGAGTIPSNAETPLVTPSVIFERVTDRNLACAVLYPTGHVPGSRPLPVVMAPYGGPHYARVVHTAGAFCADQWLADQGFAVVVVDGAGTPGRGPAFEGEVHRDLAGPVLDDQVSALHDLATRHPDLDLSRVGITGWSFGGYLAALAVLDRPDVFHAAVAGAPVTDWALYDTAYTERYLGTPQDEPDAYARTSLLTRARQLQRPLLIIHGLADDNVLVAHSLQLSSALLAAGRPHAVLPLSGVTHMTPQEEVAENLLLMEVGFLRNALG